MMLVFIVNKVQPTVILAKLININNDIIDTN